jgi:potassium-transporting ATPase KdpC subunit
MTQLRPAVVSLALLTVLTGVIYPLAVTALAQVLFPWRANGSVIVSGGKAVGSALIGQPFDDPKYFWSRLSATAAPGYNGAGSSGSNLGPLNDALTAAVQGRIDALKAADPGNTLPIPADLVTASGSGLDPHISPEAARFQLARVARSRGLPEATVAQLVARHTFGRQLGIFGEPVVEVVPLNLALDALAGPADEMRR